MLDSRCRPLISPPPLLSFSLQVADIVVKRAEAEQDQNLLITPYYDIVHQQQEHSEGEEETVAAAVERDYLTPFLQPPPGTRAPDRPLSRVEAAMAVRDRCLKALKERLIKRANIIQTRHDEETAALAKRQANFQRDRDQMSPQEEEDYEKACEEALFRIKVGWWRDWLGGGSNTPTGPLQTARVRPRISYVPAFPPPPLFADIGAAPDAPRGGGAAEVLRAGREAAPRPAAGRAQGAAVILKGAPVSGSHMFSSSLSN